MRHVSTACCRPLAYPVALALTATLIGPLPVSAQTIGHHVSGPYTFENLSIYLIHGQGALEGIPLLTLQEALEQKKLIVHETGNVNELTVENTSPDETVFIQAGEIVKGGRQDRVLGVDLIVPPSSGKVPIASFCVESGRWTQRGNETAHQFSASSFVLPTKDLKLAAQAERNQGGVWNKVAEVQRALGEALGRSVQAPASPSSLELTLEDRHVQRRLESYLDKLARIVDDKPDVIGCAIAVNGQVNSADVYAAHSLFAKLWPKLLKAGAIEAVARFEEGQTFAPLAPETVQRSLAKAKAEAITEQEKAGGTTRVRRESSASVTHETYHASADTNGRESTTSIHFNALLLQ